MAIKFNRSQTFATNGTVTASGLHNLVDGLDIYQALITDQTNLTSVGTADELLIADADLTPNDAPRAVTVQELFSDALTFGTYVDLNLSGSMTSSTATIGRLTASTATITGGTFSGSINSTTGTISTGTITNLTTTLAGDFTISQGTGTLGTSGVTSGTYGATTIIPIITIDSKGRVTTVSTALAQAGATGGGTDRVFYENDQTVTTSYTISTNKNAMSAGPVTVGSGVTVTIPDGGTWTVV
jgi:hypothetical protein